MEIDLKTLDEKLNSKFKSIDNIVSLLQEKNIDIEKAKDIFKSLSNMMEDLEKENKNLLSEIKNKITDCDNQKKVFEETFTTKIDYLWKELENVKSFSELLNSNILEVNKKIDEIISNISDLKNNLEIVERENTIVKLDIVLLNKKMAALIQANNSSFFKRLFRKKLVFEE